MSNYADLSFSDEEVITLYLFGVMDKHREIKQTYEYTDRHLRPWFPRLPSYVAFVQRLNKVAEIFLHLYWKLSSKNKRLKTKDKSGLH